MKTQYPAWQLKMMAVSAVELIAQRHHRFSIVSDGDSSNTIINGALKLLFMNHYLDIDGGYYVVSDKGKEVLRSCIAAIDVIRQFDVFSSVVPRPLTEDEWLSPQDPAFVRWDIYDPRFNRDTQDESGKDMRLAVLSWIAEKLKGNDALNGKEIDLHEVVFLQLLGCGAFTGSDFLPRLLDGSIFRDVESVVQGAFQWRQIDPDADEERASRNMQTLFTVGMLEARKRDAPFCGGENCGIPLYSFEEEARRTGVRLAQCPNPSCGRSFDPPPPSTPGISECPRCSYLVYDGDRACGGCGAIVDPRLPIGSGVGGYRTVDVPVFVDDYDYVSYGWIDPVDVAVSAVVITALCCAIW